jgi:hypothetical protein
MDVGASMPTLLGAVDPRLAVASDLPFAEDQR